MRRYLILITIIIRFGMCSYAQENINMIEILNIRQDIVSLENRIMNLIKKKPEITNIKGLRQFHVFWVSLDNENIKKEDYLNHSFLYKLIPPGYYHFGSNSLLKKEKKYLRSITSITDSIGNLVATGDARLVHVAPFFNQFDVKLAKMFFNKEIDFAFYMGGAYPTFIAIKGNKLSVVKDTQEGLKIYSWEEFIDCCFEDWKYSKKQQK